jgi:selenocysteine-specific elongation factor
MYVIGTAGHVDHGKSTLVKSLTGIDPDRWAEEQRREMTIDLGFAWLTLPSGRSVSLVDVPGHERFIKNMLAGVGGFDAALPVVAADESVMPQTAEHLAILDLLEVRHGVVALTKADLVDADWLDLVREEVAERLRGTSLEGAPIVAVSARSGYGLDDLRRALDAVLDTTPSRTGARGVPRLPVDRSFTIGGFGTVVTGTLIDGPLRLGDELEVLPSGLRARVRGLQTHNAKAERALPGTRVAVNLAGIHHSEIGRGDVLAPPATLRPTSLLDLRLRVLADAPAPILQNAALDLFSGASEAPCRVTLLDAERLDPGASGWVQLRLGAPVALARGDRCILRIASPSRTVAGGMVADTHPPRHRRFRAEVLDSLETLARGNPAELLLQALGDGPPRPWDELAAAAGVAATLAPQLIAQLRDEGRLVVLPERKETGRPGERETSRPGDRETSRPGDRETSRPGDQESASAPEGADDSPSPPLPLSLSPAFSPSLLGLLISPGGWQKLEERIGPTLRAYHGRFPLRRGIPREELRQKLRLTPRALGPLLDEGARRGLLGHDETSVWLAGHDPQPDPAGRKALDAALAAMARAPYGPPTPALDGELLAWALDRRMLVRVAPEVFFLPQTYDELLTWVRTTVAAAGSVTVGGMRDRFGSSRKYALAFLEHLDERKVTRREGEGRVLA